MFSHIAIGSNDLERSRRFYDAVIAASGGDPGRIDPKGRIVYRHRGAGLMVTQPIDGHPAQPGNGSTVGFLLDGAEMVDAWHAAGVANGGRSVEDPPGARDRLYLAYLRDPDGNKLCGLYMLEGE